MHPALLLAALLALGSGCAQPAATPGGPARCDASTPLPGAAPFPDPVRRALEASPVPDEALPASQAAPRCNRLALSHSPLLRQRSLDPVDWRPWSREVLAEAARSRRPMMVLSCFASARECGEPLGAVLGSARLAAIANADFLPVLVDREEQPEVDAWLMQAATLMTGTAGWPVLVFLDADARPFEAHSWGAASRNPEAREAEAPALTPGGRRRGEPDRRQAPAPRRGERQADEPPDRVVAEVSRRMALAAASIPERGALVAEKMQKDAELDRSGPLPDAAEALRTLVESASGEWDASRRAWGPPPLFPRAPLLAALLEAATRGDPRARRLLGESLDAMLDGSIRDAASGGFGRYASTQDWADPVGERMLADNSALAAVLVEGGKAFGQQRWVDAGVGAARFVARDLLLDDGGFANAIAAPGARKVAWRDERVFADANAIAVSALLRVGSSSGDAGLLQAARAAGAVLDSRLREGSRMRHLLRPDGSVAGGGLADAAFAGLAFLDLDEADGGADPRWLAAARAVADGLPRFAHAGIGGFFADASDEATVPLRGKPSTDAAVPASNAAAAIFLARLAERTGDAHAADQAQRTIEAFAGALRVRSVAMPAMAIALLHLEETRRALGRGAATPPTRVAP